MAARSFGGLARCGPSRRRGSSHGHGQDAVGVLAAAAAAVDAGEKVLVEKVLVLVPGRELLDQWLHVLSSG